MPSRAGIRIGEHQVRHRLAHIDPGAMADVEAAGRWSSLSASRMVGVATEAFRQFPDARQAIAGGERLVLDQGKHLLGDMPRKATPGRSKRSEGLIFMKFLWAVAAGSQ